MNIRQEVEFNASTEQVFKLLTDPALFARFTDAKAQIDASIGGQFSLFDGMITGVTLELFPNELLVQAWRPGNWPKSEYSIAKFKLLALKETKTNLTFEQTGYPAEFESHLSDGWNQKYWTPMKAFLENI